MFIDDLEAEIQAIVWKSWKMSSSSPMHFPHCEFSSTALSMHTNGENWTKWFFEDFRKWSVSRFLDHLWTWSEVYFKVSTFVSNNMK